MQLLHHPNCQNSPWPWKQLAMLVTKQAVSQRQSSALMGLVVKVISTVKKQKAEFMESTKPLLWYKLSRQKHVASWTKY